jgi:hypothetical protein
MIAAPGSDHLRLPPPDDAVFKLKAENGIAFADACGMADPVMRPADRQRDQKHLAAADFQAGHAHGGSLLPLGQKIEAVVRIVPVRLSLVARCAAIGLLQLRIADLPIFVLGCCELHSQKQAQLKVGAFEPQPSVYQN